MGGGEGAGDEAEAAIAGTILLRMRGGGWRGWLAMKPRRLRLPGSLSMVHQPSAIAAAAAVNSTEEKSAFPPQSIVWALALLSILLQVFQFARD
eukprot:COSAG02_NODE_717_length_18070_cov_20.762700_14_plen_94_part_00